jgi:type I restriction enzyme S subunit
LLQVVREELFSVAKGSTYDAVTVDEVARLRGVIPPRSEQQAIAQEIESRLSVCDQFEQTIEDSLKKAEALRQSILKKAFSGELTRQWREKHPELITGENSAEKLLEKIKAEKALAAGLKRPRARKAKKK